MRLCRFGLHKYVFSDKWLPSINAPIVTDVIFQTKCAHCGKIKHYSHLVWNGEDMVEK